jgi:hypothetical protein
MADNPILFPKWQPQLTAAIRETDPRKLAERIREVQEILASRSKRILGSRPHAAEMDAIEDAWDVLEVLKKKVSQSKAS